MPKVAAASAAVPLSTSVDAAAEIAGATNVTVRSGPQGLGSSTANCISGERAVGGGGVTPDTDSFLWGSEPNVDGGTPTGWVAQAVVADGLGTDANVTAYVICAAP